MGDREHESSAPNSTLERPTSSRTLARSTWAAIILTMGVLAIVEIPGRRTGLTSYEHGWPFVYMARDYKSDSTFSSQSRKKSNDWQFFYLGPPKWLQSSPDNAIDDPLSWNVEEKMNPWSVAYSISFNKLACGVDALLAFAAVAALGFAVQWRAAARRRKLGYRPFQFRLQTLFVAAVVVSLAAAKVAGWNREYRAEQQALRNLGDRVSSRTSRWIPPNWLPESLIKATPLAESFNRVEEIGILVSPRVDSVVSELAPMTRLKGLWFQSVNGLTDTGAAKLSELSNLESLSIGDYGFSGYADVVLGPLAGLSHLNSLTLTRTNLTDDGLARLGSLPALSELHLEEPGITAGGVKRLAENSRLKRLWVDGFEIDDDAIEALNRVQSLEEIKIGRTTCHQIDLRGLPKLSKLTIECLRGSNGRQPLPETSALTAVSRQDKFWHPTVRLKELPALKALCVDGALFDEAGVRDLCKLPSLEVVELHGVQLKDLDALRMTGGSKLRALTIIWSSMRALDLRSLPSLESVFCEWNDRLRTAHLAQLPKLESMTLGSARLRSVRLAELPNLKQLRVIGRQRDNALVGISSLGVEPPPLPPSPLRVVGFGGLSSLHEVALINYRLDGATLAELARVKNLRSFAATNSWLSDSEFSQFAALTNIESLYFRGTDLTPRSFDTMKAMKSLKELNLEHTLVYDDDAVVMSFKAARPEVTFAASPASSPEKGREKAKVDQLRHAFYWTDWDVNLCDDDLAPLHRLNPDGVKRATVLYLARSRITDAGLHHLRGLTSLTKLSLSGNHITDAGLLEIAKLRTIESLELDLTGVSGPGLANLSKLASLKHLSLRETPLTDEGLAVLKSLRQLESLNVSKTLITDDGVRNLTELPNLSRLQLHNTDLTDAAIAELKKIKTLRELGTDGTHITDLGVAEIKAAIPEVNVVR